jgi:hypothetical protein
VLVDVKGAKQVVYKSDRAVDGNKDFDTFKELVLLTKFKSWEYEKEWRVLVALDSATKEGNLHFWPYDDTLRLKEVILGPLCSLNIDAVRSAVEKHCPDAVTFSSRLVGAHVKLAVWWLTTQKGRASPSKVSARR